MINCDYGFASDYLMRKGMEEMLEGKVLTCDAKTRAGKIRQKHTGRKFPFLASACRSFIVGARGPQFDRATLSKEPAKGDHVLFNHQRGMVCHWGYKDDRDAIITPEVERLIFQARTEEIIAEVSGMAARDLVGAVILNEAEVVGVRVTHGGLDPVIRRKN